MAKKPTGILYPLRDKLVAIIEPFEKFDELEGTHTGVLPETGSTIRLRGWFVGGTLLSTTVELYPRKKATQALVDPNHPMTRLRLPTDDEQFHIERPAGGYSPFGSVELRNDVHPTLANGVYTLKRDGSVELSPLLDGNELVPKRDEPKLGRLLDRIQLELSTHEVEWQEFVPFEDQ